MSVNKYVANPERELAADINDFFRQELITEKELKNPVKTKINTFYSMVLSEFGIEVTQVMQPQMKQVDCLGGNIEYFSDLIPLINMVEAIKCLQIPGFQDFSIMHLMNPMPKPTLKYMRIMMNFVHFADEHLASLRQKFGRVSDAKTKREFLFEQRENLKDRITQRASQLKIEESGLANIDSEIDNKRVSLNELKNEKEKWQEQYEKVKAELTKISDIRDKQLSETQMIENDLKEFQNRLKGRNNVHNTSSGSSHLLSLETLKMKANNLKEENFELQQKLTTRQVELEFKLKFQSEYPFLKSKLEEVVELLEQKRVIINKQTQLAQEMTTIEDTIKLLDSTANNLTCELVKNKENLNGLKLKWSLEETALKEALNENLRKNKSVTKTYNELLVQSVELENELESLDKKITENEETFKAICDKCNESYEADRQKLKEWKKNLLEKLKSGNVMADNIKILQNEF